MKELLEEIVKSLVDHPDHIQIRSVEGEQLTIFELRVYPCDLRKVIGRQGRMAKTIRIILSGVGITVGHNNRGSIGSPGVD